MVHKKNSNVLQFWLELIAFEMIYANKFIEI